MLRYDLGFLLLLAVLLLHPPASGQIRLEAGDRIRVVTSPASPGGSRDLDGEIVSAYSDELTLRTLAGGEVHVIEPRHIRELFGYRPRNERESTWRGARVGGFVGLSVGAIAGPLISSAGIGGPLGETILISSISGAALGAVAGAVAGAALASDGWQRYRLPVEWISLTEEPSAWRIAVTVPVR